ncbi:MAG: Ig-like domain-containing protein [Candidatus Methanoperedens sp.]|nr:Ig-like domain-containing protein [Candidatus Methanoperedens sp.]
MDSLTPGIVNANVASDVTIAGGNLAQDGYNTEVLIDGAVVAYSSLTETSAVVNVNLVAGGHSVQVKKTNVTIPTDTTTSAVTSLSAIASPTITSAELASGVLTITGSAFGTDDMTSVTITKADGRKILAATTSWTDTVIVANGADAAAGDSVTVLTKTGSATATITEPPTLTTITVEPTTANLKVRDTQVFTATAKDQNGNPMSGITITWSSSNTWVGTVNPTSATTDSNGQATTTFTAAHPGDAIVSASSGSVSGSANVHV